MKAQVDIDRRFMAAAIRYARRHLGLTATNPSVATFIVSSEAGFAEIIGRGVTAVGGRPHAEPLALAQAGERASGATAYVTLEPCAHHGRTPPCAVTLIEAGIKRVVGAAADPDPRVAGRGYRMLREAGVDVVEGVLAEPAADLMAGYLIRSLRKRPEVTLKMALSRDGMIGVKAKGQVAITGTVSNAQVHLMRAQSDAILIGASTAISDDPALTCRLPGLEDRSPVRIVLDGRLRLPENSILATTANDRPVLLAAGFDATVDARKKLGDGGVRFLPLETHDGRMALPELLEDLAGQGIMTLMVEGGALTASSFLEDDLVDRLVLITGPGEIGHDGIRAPITPESVPSDFGLSREMRFGSDDYREWVRPTARRFGATGVSD